MDSNTDRRHSFRPTGELPDIFLAPELYAQFTNIIVRLDRHFLILQPADMCYELLRLLTFILYFPRNIGIHVIRAYAIAGFYCTRERDFVVCYRCGFSFGNLEPGTDDPYEVHQRNAPDCDFFHNRMINIPFFLVTEGGLRRSNERTAIRHRVSTGPSSVMPADEVQRNILRIIERHRDINGEHFVIDINNGNHLPVQDLRQGRIRSVNTLTAINSIETFNTMVNEIPLSVSDLGIDIRPDFSHRLEWSESESVLDISSNRLTHSYHPHILSIRALTGVTQEEEESSMSDRLEEPEIAIATNEYTSLLQQENSTDTHGGYFSERFSDDESELGSCNSNEISFRKRGIMTADLPLHQHISYDSIDRGENENTFGTHHSEETQLKIVCETEMKGNHPESENRDLSVRKSDNEDVTGENANSEETCRKTLHSSGFSSRMNVAIPNEMKVTTCSQFLVSNLSDQTAKVASFQNCPRFADTEPVGNGISPTKAVDSDGNVSDNSHFKLLAGHREPVCANISSDTNELIYEGIDVNIPSKESQHKGDENHAKSSLDGTNIPVQVLSGIHSVKDNTITADCESKWTETHGNAVRESSTETHTGEEDNFDAVEQKRRIPSEDKNSVKMTLTSKDANYEIEQNVLKDVTRERNRREKMKQCKSDTGMASNTEVVNKPGTDKCFNEDRMEKHVKHLNCREKITLDVALNDSNKTDLAKQNMEHTCESVESVLFHHDDNGQLGACSFSSRSIPDNASKKQHVLPTNLDSSQPLSDISAKFADNATAAAAAANTWQEYHIRETLGFGADNFAKEHLPVMVCGKKSDIHGVPSKSENYSRRDVQVKNKNSNLPSDGCLCKSESPSDEMEEEMEIGPTEQSTLGEKSESESVFITVENSNVMVLNAPESDKSETEISQPEDSETQEENIAAPLKHVAEYHVRYRHLSASLLPTFTTISSQDISLTKRRKSWTTSTDVDCATSKHNSSTQYCWNPDKEQSTLGEESESESVFITVENSNVMVLNAPESDKSETEISQPEDSETQEENIAAPLKHVAEYHVRYRHLSASLLPTFTTISSQDISLTKRRNSWTTSTDVDCATSKHNSSTQYCWNQDKDDDLNVCLRQISNISDDPLATQTCLEDVQCDMLAPVNAREFHQTSETKQIESAKRKKSNESNAADVDNLIKSALSDLHKIKDPNRKKTAVLNFHKEIIDVQSQEISDSDKSLKCVDSCKRYFGLFVRCMSYMNDCCNQGM